MTRVGVPAAESAAILLPLLWPAVALMGADEGRGKDQDGLANQRETVLDRKAHIEAGITKEVPQVPPLCDGIAGLAGKQVDIERERRRCELHRRLNDVTVVELPGALAVRLDAGPRQVIWQ
ncbi:MAG: hypothetical protein NTW87_00125 [Planctomycetota bacterium]|nr:hypothetical protein [Planctomycetota bacterium]